MGSSTINVKTNKKCAICQHWYDPTNSAITPKTPSIGLWVIKDTSQRCMCLKRNTKTSAIFVCGRDFVSKF